MTKRSCSKEGCYDTPGEARYALQVLAAKGIPVVRFYRCGKHSRTTYHVTKRINHRKNKRR